MLKLLAGSFLAFLAVEHFVPLPKAVEPTRMYLVAFGYVFSSPQMALAFTGAFVVISQLKINVTNAYAGSIAWSNFFSRLTHSHPGRVVWLVFNVTIALMLMELGIFKMLEHALGLYSIVAVSWVSALVADLVINKPLGLSPAGIQFKRAHLYDINPVGVGAMFAATVVGIAAFCGLPGTTLQSLSSFLALAVAFVMAPLIAWATHGRFYIARSPRQNWNGQEVIGCSICEHHFEAEDMAHCPAYSGAICSLCCSLETRCRDCCKPQARVSNQLLAWFGEALPERIVPLLNTHVGRYLGVLSLFVGVIGAVLSLVYFLIALDMEGPREVLISTLWTVFFILIIIAGVAAWLFVLAQESRRVAEEETSRQTDLLMNEIEAHKRTDAKLQKAKEVAEAASTAKSRHVVGLSHELRTPLNAILGYAQLLERDPAIPKPRLNAIRVVRRSAEHLSGLIDGLLDISKIEAGRFHLSRNEVQLSAFLDEIVAMFRLQATAKGIEFRHVRTGRLPVVIQTDENRLRQILINLLSNAIKFTDAGHVTFRVRYHHQVAEFTVEDTGVGIHSSDLERIFQPFERARTVGALATDRHGAWADDHQPVDQDHGRRHLRRKRSRQGQHIPREALAFRSHVAAHRLNHGIPRPRIWRPAADGARGGRQRGAARAHPRPAGALRLRRGERRKRPRMPANCRADEPEISSCSTLRCREWTAGKWRSNCAAIKANVRQYLFFRRTRSIPTTCSKPSGSTTIR